MRFFALRSFLLLSLFCFIFSFLSQRAHALPQSTYVRVGWSAATVFSDGTPILPSVNPRYNLYSGASSTDLSLYGVFSSTGYVIPVRVDVGKTTCFAVSTTVNINSTAVEGPKSKTQCIRPQFVGGVIIQPTPTPIIEMSMPLSNLEPVAVAKFPITAFLNLSDSSDSLPMKQFKRKGNLTLLKTGEYKIQDCNFDDDGKADSSKIHKGRFTAKLSTLGEKIKFKIPKGDIKDIYCADFNNDKIDEVLFLTSKKKKEKAVRARNVPEYKTNFSVYNSDGKIIFKVAAPGALQLVASGDNANGDRTPGYIVKLQNGEYEAVFPQFKTNVKISDKKFRPVKIKKQKK